MKLGRILNTKLIRSTFAFFLATGLSTAAQAELYVSRVGDGATALGTSSAQVSVLQYDNAGGLLSTINLPTADSGANKAFSLRGSSTSQGFITASTDGQYLTMSGFMVAPGVASISGTNSATAPRGVARITISGGVVDTTTVFSGDTSYSGSDPRSAVSTNGTDIWVGGTAGSGADGGVRYTTLGSTTSTQVNTGVTNTRVVNISSALTGSPQLLVTTMSGAFRGVSTVGTGVPNTSGNATTLLTGFDPSNSAPQDAYDFWFKDANTLYLADNRAAAPGGLQKWTFDSGSSTWSLAYSSLFGSAGARGLAGTIDGSDTVLYVTTTEAADNRLVKAIDTGSGFTTTDLATAGANNAFRGVEFVSGAPTIFDVADFNHDTKVDDLDLTTWRNNFSTGTTNAQGDASGDMLVDGQDLLIWQQHETDSDGAIAAVGAVPEPAAAALALLAGAAVLSTRRRK